MAYTNDSKPTSSYSNDAMPSSSYSNDIKPSSTTNYLLKEDSYFLLLETGDKIVLARSIEYTNDLKPS